MDVIVSDFDDTLFKRNHGLIQPVVSYLETRGFPIYIVTHRNETQSKFIQDTLAESNLTVVGLGMTGSKVKDPMTKYVIVRDILTRHNVVEALEDDAAVLERYQSLGIKVKLIT